MECNKQVTSLLDHLYDQRTAGRLAPSLTVCPGVPVAQDTAQISQSEASDQVRLCWHVIAHLDRYELHLEGHYRLHLQGEIHKRQQVPAEHWYIFQESNLYTLCPPLCVFTCCQKTLGVMKICTDAKYWQAERLRYRGVPI